MEMTNDPDTLRPLVRRKAANEERKSDRFVEVDFSQVDVAALSTSARSSCALNAAAVMRHS
jgi:hypothetical protein